MSYVDEQDCPWRTYNVIYKQIGILQCTVVNVTKEAHTKDGEHRDWRDRVASMQRRECAVRWRGGQNTGWWSQQGRLWLDRQVAICSGIRTDLGAGIRNSGHIHLQGGIYCQESDLSDVRLQDKDTTRPKEELGSRTRSPTSGLSFAAHLHSLSLL